MIWWLIGLLMVGFTISQVADDPTPPVPFDTTPATEVAPPPTAQPVPAASWPCNTYDSDEGVKGRIRAVPVLPQDRC